MTNDMPQELLLPGRERKKAIYRVTLIGTAANLLLVGLKFAAGIIGRSSAMIADAVHSLSDFGTDVVVLFFVNASAKPKDEGHNYGHGKFETLATVVIGLVLLGVGAGILWNSADRILFAARGGVLPRPELIAAIAGLISIGVKEWLFRLTRRTGRKTGGSVLEANAWHHRSDALSSIATVVGISGAIFLGEPWRVLDPIAAALVSLLIGKVALDLLFPAVKELLEVSLPQPVQGEILSLVGRVPDVWEPHNLRTRRIGNNYAIEIHIRVDNDKTVVEAHRIATAVEAALKAKYGPDTHISVHVEPREK